MYAGKYDHIETTKLLIDAGANRRDINQINLFKLKHPNLFKAAIIYTVAGVGIKFGKILINRICKK